jgi:hypothetical protein
MRRSELSGADWLIPAERYKSKIDHLIPLSTTAQSLVRKDGDLIFTLTGNYPITGFSVFKSDLDKASGVSG